MKEAIRRIRMSERKIEEERSNAALRNEVLKRLSEHEFWGTNDPPNYSDFDLDAVCCLSHTDLLNMAASPDVANRARAICVIGAKKEGSLETCKTIDTGLAHDHRTIRSLTVYALGRIASANTTTIASAMNLVPTLLNLLKCDKSWHVRKAAAEALGAIGTESNEALQGLIQVVEKEYDPKDRYGRVKVAAIEALGKFGEAASAAVPHLKEYQPGGRQANESLIVSYETLLRIASKDSDIVNDVLPKLIANVETKLIANVKKSH